LSLTPEGFVRPRLDELKTALDQSFTDALGPVNTEADSVTGQIIGILAAALDDNWEALQNTYDSMYPATAEDTALDGAVAYVGMERLEAAATTVVAMAYGTEGTLIPSGALARALDNRQYATTVDTVISRASAGDVDIEVNTVSNATAYQVIVGGVSVTYTSDGSATISEIVNGLAALFDGDVILATVNDDDDVLRLRAVDQYSEFTLTVDSKLTITSLGTPVTFTGLDLGAYALPANTLTRIDSTQLGWDTINNLVAGNTGRFVESDEDLRIRHLSGVRAEGSATVKAIRARLLAEVDSVDYVAVYQNATGTVDSSGAPAHSFEAVVDGGLSQDVADKIFEVGPAGIESYGNTTVAVVDDNGDSQSVKFSRPTAKYAWVRVTVDSFNTEETLTTEIEQAIIDAALAYGNSVGIGDDIITQRFYGPIFDATSGLAELTIEVDITDAELDSPTYSTSNVVLTRAQRAVFDADRISVVGL
jgi:uncharacterized phage protein gp47/JayE